MAYDRAQNEYQNSQLTCPTYRNFPNDYNVLALNNSNIQKLHCYDFFYDISKNNFVTATCYTHVPTYKRKTAQYVYRPS